MLYSVALPIGNEQDISFHAVQVLEKVELILAEDTRKFFDMMKRTKTQVSGKVISYHSYNEEKIIYRIKKELDNKNSIAIVSDRGTPNISDPGRKILQYCFENNIKVSPIAGASALSTIMSVLPFPNEPLLFLGFLSNKKQRKENTLLKYKEFQGCIVLFESVHRIINTLEIIKKVYSENMMIFIAREMTKIYENFFYGSPLSAIEWCLQNKKGEFTIAIFMTKKNKSEYVKD